MLKIEVPGHEFYNEKTGEFFTVHAQTLELEHSLLSISKWEAKWHKPYFGKEPKTEEEALDYLRCMSLRPVSDPMIFSCLTRENVTAIYAYINDPMTATTFSTRSVEGKRKNSSKFTTSEEIYYSMFSYGIPIECQKWHINRLTTLLHIFAIREAPPKKQSKKQILADYAALNAKRRAATGSRG